MMRFRKGGKVEVLGKKELPSSSWRSAEILSGNGHTYSVRYDCSSGLTSDAIVDRVSRKFIRPSPPVVSVKRWIIGDTVEVFYDNCWKAATILKLMGKGYYLVMLLSTPHHFEVHQSNIRVRQLWKDGKWIVLEMGSASFAELTCNKRSTPICKLHGSQKLQAISEWKDKAGGDQLTVGNNIGLEEPPIISSQTLKRASPYCPSHDEAYTRNPKRRKAVENGSRHPPILLTPFLEKVDAAAHPRETLGENYMDDSFDDRSPRYSELKRRKPPDVLESFSAGSAESNDFGSDACSIGSCSVNNNSFNPFSGHIPFDPLEGTHSFCTDAQSLYQCGHEEEKCTLLPEEDIAAKIHKLELHAYWSTLQALFVYGSLNWEQEALLTDLRLLLHISNDEHLMEDHSRATFLSCLL